MSDTVIKVENLNKLYCLGELHKQTNSFRDKVTSAFRRTLCSIRRAPNALPQNAMRYAPCAMPSSSSDHIWALKDVSFEVKKGEILGIIGRNGAGKSTLLKILSRITKPTRGKALINGRVGSLLEVGTGFHPELTGRENIYLNSAILGMRKAEVDKKFDEIVAFAEIDKFIDTPVKRYSSGMYVRLAFAVAAHLEPEILLVDEVLAVGDLKFQQKCIGKMNEVSQEGRTVLLVSHNMQTINSLSTRAICLENGAIVDLGKSTEVTINYLNQLQAIEDDETIPDSKRVAKSDYLKIIKVLLLNSKGEKAPTLYFREPFQVKLIFKVMQPVEQVRLGFAICTPDGTRISTTHHTDGGLKPLVLEKGYYSFIAHVKNYLVPGYYSLEVGAHDLRTTRGIDSVPNVVDFSVVGFSEEETYLHDPYNSSFTYLPAHWSEVIHSDKP